MKFGAQIKSNRYEEWAPSYLDYDALKKFIKNRLASNESAGVLPPSGKKARWTVADEGVFLGMLQAELEKITKFQDDKVAEINGQMVQYDERISQLVARGNRHSARSIESSRAPSRAEPANGSVSIDIPSGEEADLERVNHDLEQGHHDHGDDTDNDEIERINDEFLDLEEALASLIADVHDLGTFTRLNYTGFYKILKKHDKQTEFSLRATFIRQYLDKNPFYKENYDALIVQLSRLYNLVRTRGHPVTGDSSAGGSQGSFVRATTKYWVHQDNFVEVKLQILKHLPVLVFNEKKAFDPEDAAISSIYFDNDDFFLYLGRLEKTEGAEAVRLRWYGGMKTEQIFVERKTHREDWTGEKSVKARFDIQEHLVNDYLAGTHDPADNIRAKIEKANNKKPEAARKPKEELEKTIQQSIDLAHEIQNTVRGRKLHPMIRTFYNRTAFQLPGDARVRISFDTQLNFVREDNLDAISRAGKNWRRMDIGIDEPFTQVPEEDRYEFPYGVLEVKLQTQHGQAPPTWVTELVSSHLVECVPKFSKFIHACATLYPNRVQLIPFWLPQMDVDIRRPATKSRLKIERPSHPGSAGSPATPGTPGTRSSDAGDDIPPDYTEPLSEDEEDEDNEIHAATSNNELHVAGVPADKLNEARAHREKLLVAKANGAVTPRATLRGKKRGADAEHGPIKLTPNNLAAVLGSDLVRRRKAVPEEESDEEERRPIDPDEIALQPGRIEYVSSFKASDGKRISVPIRVEPKVYMATERTFLAWFEFSVILSAIGVGLLNFTSPNDNVGFAAATTFTVIALLALVYCGLMFIYRTLKIRAKQAIHYDDRYGPTALCGVIVVGAAVNFVMRWKGKV